MAKIAKPGTSELTIRGPADFAAAFDVSRETIARLQTYETLLRQWQKAVNLVAPSTLDAVWHRHFADSAQLVALAPTARAWVDLGSGGGFPGMVIAILLAEAPGSSSEESRQKSEPEITAASVVPSPLVGEGQGGGDGRASNVGSPPTPHPSPPGGGESGGRSEPQSVLGAARIILIESDTRKCAFLREVARQTGVAVDILSTRIESAATQIKVQPPDVVTARALAPLDKLLSLAAPLFSSRAVGLFLKGREVTRDVEKAQKTWTFKSELIQSRTDPEAHIVRISALEPNRKEPRS
jgi:16S rRNA G527 N7-methylase RsmG